MKANEEKMDVDIVVFKKSQERCHLKSFVVVVWLIELTYPEEFYVE